MPKSRNKRQPPLTIGKRVLSKLQQKLSRSVQDECRVDNNKKTASVLKSKLPKDKDVEYSPLHVGEVVYIEILKVHKELSEQELVRIGIELIGGTGDGLEEFVQGIIEELIKRKVLAYNKKTDLVTLNRERK